MSRGFIGNAGVDWVNCVEGQNGINGNISADPLFCDLAYDHLRLDESSPCAPDNPAACGLIGAHGAGCRTTAVNPTTWGHIKSMWRGRRAEMTDTLSQNISHEETRRLEK